MEGEMAEINRVKGRQILDSRGNPTLEVEIELKNGVEARASIPSGASTGKHEALELRDGGKEFNGKGVKKAVEIVNLVIAPKILGRDVYQQREIDYLLLELDGTPNKRNLGANSILGVSLAVAKAAADSLSLPLYRYLGGVNAHLLPTPMMNVLNGGMHADNKLDIQEFMILPVGADTFSKGYQMAAETFQTLKKLLKEKNYSTAVGDEGGFAPSLSNNREALSLILSSIEKSGYKPGEDIALAIDSAASSFYEDGKYRFEGKAREADEMIDYYAQIVEDFPIISIEDGLAEDDWDGWKRLTERLGKGIQIVGDDIFVTNPERLQRGIEEKSANSILIKVNQIGSLTETIETIELAKKSGFTTVISHRSGETEETFIADLAVGLNCGQIKSGSLSRSERLCKYNQLLRIEEELGKSASFAGKTPFTTKAR